MIGLRRAFALASLLVVACSDASAPCPSGTERCEGICVDLSEDSRHCGGCGNACAPGETCAEGACVPGCGEGRTSCAGRCVDLREDVDHCGACGNACPAGTICAAGSCELPCDDGLTACAGECVDLDADAHHCGACGNRCASGARCVEGRCTCPEPTTYCGDGCFDLDRNPHHCGECGNACGEGEFCREGKCVCDAGRERCGSLCVNIATDPDHCGGCGQSCGDQPHASGGLCLQGFCSLQCGPGYADCDRELENGCETWVDGDEENCGGCGIRCGSEGVAELGGCVEGTCQFVCATGRADCDLVPGNGCEVDVRSDVAHCGACYQDCAALPNVEEVRCEDGGCVIESCRPGFADCNGETEDGCERVTVVPSDAPLELQCAGPLEVQAGWSHACMRTSAGEVWCWGSSSSGQGGVTTRSQSSVPLRVPLLDGVTDLVAGSGHTCVLSHGDLHCWGSDFYGQLGGGDFENRPYESEKRVLSGVREVAAGDEHTCALTEAGEVWCWGRNRQLQIGVTYTNISGVPLRVRGLDGWEDLHGLRAGALHNCILGTRDGEGPHALCWGEGVMGQLGGGVLENSAEPVVTEGPFHELFLGSSFTCARGDAGVSCWGNNSGGQLGMGSEEHGPFPTPQQVVGLPPVTWIGGSPGHVCATDEEGSVWCWGFDSNGRFGTGASAGARPTPTRVPELSTLGIRQLSGGSDFVCGVTSENQVQCWGQNSSGQLGDGTKEHRHEPAPILY